MEEMRAMAGERRMRLLTVALAGAVIALIPPAVSQTNGQAPAASRDLEALARRLPDCKEFRNACQVCVRSADGKLACSNIAIACNPSGEWRCSIPSASDDQKK